MNNNLKYLLSLTKLLKFIPFLSNLNQQMALGYLSIYHQ